MPNGDILGDLTKIGQLTGGDNQWAATNYSQLGSSPLDPTTFGESLENLGLEQFSQLFGEGADPSTYFGLPGGFEQYFMPFQTGRYEEMMAGLEPYREQQAGFLGRAHDIGVGRATTEQNLLQSLLGIGKREAGEQIGFLGEQEQIGLGRVGTERGLLQSLLGIGRGEAEEQMGFAGRRFELGKTALEQESTFGKGMLGLRRTEAEQERGFLGREYGMGKTAAERAEALARKGAERQFISGRSRLRESLLGEAAGLRGRTGGFAGGGAQARAQELLTRTAGGRARELGAEKRGQFEEASAQKEAILERLGLRKERGLAGVEGELGRVGLEEERLKGGLLGQLGQLALGRQQEELGITTGLERLETTTAAGLKGLLSQEQQLGLEKRRGVAGIGAGLERLEARTGAGLEGVESQLQQLGLTKDIGIAGLQEEIEKRKGMGESLIADYLQNIMQTALQIKGFDPTGTKDTTTTVDNTETENDLLTEQLKSLGIGGGESAGRVTDIMAEFNISAQEIGAYGKQFNEAGGQTGTGMNFLAWLYNLLGGA